MQKTEFKEIEAHMLGMMGDSAHDAQHVYRVLYAALAIAEHEADVDADILIAACLLHDIGRGRQFEDLELCHAEIGGDMAYDFLLARNWNERRALHVKKCIQSHRHRRNNQPDSVEAKILFDADKLDVSGTIGIARSLLYEGKISEPIYVFDAKGDILLDASDAEFTSFFQEFNYKLRNLYGKFHTEFARELAQKHKQAALNFYDNLLDEVSERLEYAKELDKYLE